MTSIDEFDHFSDYNFKSKLTPAIKYYRYPNDYKQ